MTDQRDDSTDVAPGDDRRTATDGGEDDGHRESRDAETTDAGDERVDDGSGTEASVDSGAGLDHPTESVENPSIENGPGAADADEDGMSTTRKYVYWITMGMALLVGFAFVIAFYSNVQSVINEWIARRYRLLFSTAFNLAMVLAAGIVVSLLLRRMEAGRS